MYFDEKRGSVTMLLKTKGDAREWSNVLWIQDIDDVCIYIQTHKACPICLKVINLKVFVFLFPLWKYFAFHPKRTFPFSR